MPVADITQSARQHCYKRELAGLCLSSNNSVRFPNGATLITVPFQAFIGDFRPELFQVRRCGLVSVLFRIISTPGHLGASSFNVLEETDLISTKFRRTPTPRREKLGVIKLQLDSSHKHRRQVRVKSGHCAVSSRCPLYPNSGRCNSAAKCPLCAKSGHLTRRKNRMENRLFSGSANADRDSRAT